MKLLTKELVNKFQKIGSQANELDPIVVAKYFNPCGSETWYATEYFPEENICFGYVTGMYVDEFGYFSLTELQEHKLPLGLRIERDIYTATKRISEHCPELIEKIERARELQKIEKQKEQSRDNEMER
jgi:hypothetical protein